jgi:hypothetical protein
MDEGMREDRKRTELKRFSILPMSDASFTVSGALQKKS